VRANIALADEDLGEGRFPFTGSREQIRAISPAAVNRCCRGGIRRVVRGDCGERGWLLERMELLRELAG